MGKRSRGVVAVAVAGIVVLAGCGSDAPAEGTGQTTTSPSSEPTPSQTSAQATPSASPSTTASAAGPAVAVPPEAQAHTEAGAEAFAKFFYEVVSESQYRADSTELRALSSPDCEGCQVLIQMADELSDKGHRMDSRSLKVKGAGVRPDSTRDVKYVNVLAEDLPSKVLDRSGNVVSRSTGAKLTFLTTLIWNSSAWQVQDSELLR